MLSISISEPTPEQTLAARIALQVYIALVPRDPYALSWLADLLASDYLNRWNEAENHPAAGRHLLLEAQQRVLRALDIDGNLSRAHYANGLVQRALGNYDCARTEFATAARLNPNFAAAYAQEGNEYINLSQFDRALELVEEAMNLIPSGENAGIFYWIQGRAYFFKKNYKSAIQSLRKSVVMRNNIWYNRLYLVSALTKRIPGQQSEIETPQDELGKFKHVFPLFTRDTLDEYEKDVSNDLLDFNEFHAGLDDAQFKRGDSC